MIDASPRTLKILAALVWYSGVVVLFYKSTRLLIEAERINPDQPWTWLAILGGLLLGIIKAKYLFKRVCLKNLLRIDSIQQPKLWQFYRVQFFIFLLMMIVLGSYAFRQAYGNYSMLITFGLIQISLATALLGSSDCFWKRI